MTVLRRNNVHIRGTGDRAMLFVQGWGCDQDIWQLVAPSFSHDFVTVLFDHVGTGESQWPAYSTHRYSTLDAYAEDIVEIGNRLDLQHAVIVGHSCGGIIGALASIIAPDMFDELILIAPSARYIDGQDYCGGFSEEDVADMLTLLESDYVAWSARIAPLLMANPERPALSDALADNFGQSDPATTFDFARLSFQCDERDRLRSVTAPTLVLQSHQDIFCPPTATRYVHDCIPNSKLVQLNSRGHFPQISAPAKTVSAIHTFLRAARGGAARRKSGFPLIDLAHRGMSLLDAGEQSSSSVGAAAAEAREQALTSLVNRQGELLMQLGRYDMYALTLQQILEPGPAPDLTSFTVRSRGSDIERLMRELAPQLLPHFLETKRALEEILDRHAISARHAAAIPGIRRTRDSASTAHLERDWFDRHNAGTAIWLATIDSVERDILKVVSLCFRISHCALRAQKYKGIGN